MTTDSFTSVKVIDVTAKLSAVLSIVQNSEVAVVVERFSSFFFHKPQT